jgi:hypothetical protein
MTADTFSKLAELSTGDVRPFPYEACRSVSRDNPRYNSLIPDLDTYLSELAGYASWGTRIRSWPDEKIEGTRRRLASSFHERFPVYRDMELASADRSDLREVLAAAERTRKLLLVLLEQLQLERTSLA